MISLFLSFVRFFSPCIDLTFDANSNATVRADYRWISHYVIILTSVSMCVRGARTLFSRVPLVRAARLPRVALAQRSTCKASLLISKEIKPLLTSFNCLSFVQECRSRNFIRTFLGKLLKKEFHVNFTCWCTNENLFNWKSILCVKRGLI